MKTHKHLKKTYSNSQPSTLYKKVAFLHNYANIQLKIVSEHFKMKLIHGHTRQFWLLLYQSWRNQRRFVVSSKKQVTLLSMANKSNQSINTTWYNWRKFLALLESQLYGHHYFSYQISSLFFHRWSSHPHQFEEFLFIIVNMIACS